MTSRPLSQRLRSAKMRIPVLAVQTLGLRSSWVGYRSWKKETPREYLARRTTERSASGTRGAGVRTIHPETVFRNPLPRNIRSRDALPDTRGWWGYSFHDVPERRGGETYLATLPDCRVAHYVHPENRQFYPAILGSDDRSIEMREIRFREEHADLLRLGNPPVQRLEKATWILERVHRNYSHWFTAHLPKLLLLREEGLLEHVLLPRNPSSIMRESLRMTGFDVESFPTYDPEAVLEVEELTVLGTDRFRPELLRSVQEAMTMDRAGTIHARRRIFISREKAPRRRLVNEEEIWKILEPFGFERVIMEDLPFPEQVALMSETAILFSIHGAGLTNMMFCGRGTHVVEIADLSFPNPNFYAIASALDHPYWLLSGTPIGDEHPLRRDMRADPESVRALLPRLLAAAP